MSRGIYCQKDIFFLKTRTVQAMHAFAIIFYLGMLNKVGYFLKVFLLRGYYEKEISTFFSESQSNDWFSSSGNKSGG